MKFDFFAEEGQCFRVPYHHKDEGHVYCILWEAKEGTRMDKFKNAKSGPAILEAGKAVIKDLCPWEHHLLDDMEALEDPYGWVAGRFPPTVRKPYGELPSGAKVIPVGDTAVTFDPIGGQGGNHANKHAKHLADQVIARGDQAFDTDWMKKVNDDWWHGYAKFAYAFNNTLLEPLTTAGKALLLEVARNETFASERFFPGFPNPRSFFPAFEHLPTARKQVRAFRDAKRENTLHPLPGWTNLIKAQVAIRSIAGKQNFPSPGFKTSVMENAQ